MRWKHTHYTVPASVSCKLLLLTDLHYYDAKMQSVLEALLLEVSKTKVDYICMSGDFIDEREIQQEEIFLAFLEKLSKLAKVILSVGNHEVKTKTDTFDQINESLFSKIQKIDHVYLLMNQSYEDENIRFTGLYFPFSCYEEKEDSEEKTYEAMTTSYQEGLLNNKYNVVLSHSPYLLLYPSVRKLPIYQTADLILSGHTHGGLTPTFLSKIFKRVLITPARHFFPKNSYGYLKREKTIVSSGITKLSHFNCLRHFNFLFSKEIVWIELKKEC